MVKKLILSVFFSCISIPPTSCFEYVKPVLNGANSMMDYANKGWLQRILFVSSGSLVLTTIVYAALGWGKEDEEYKVTKEAFWLSVYDLSTVLALHYVWHRWLPAQEWRGIGAIGSGLVLCIPFMTSKKDALQTAAILLVSAIGTVKFVKITAEWLFKKKGI